MTRRKNIISILIAMVVILSALCVFPLTLTASAVSVTIGSGLFSSANTKNMTIKGTDDGLALRVDQKEYAYTEWTDVLPMNGFSMDFKIIDDNFEKLDLTFSSMYDEKNSADCNIVNNMPETNDDQIKAKEEAKKALIQPEKVKNIITLTKQANGVGVAINPTNENDKTTIDSGWKNFEFTVSYDGSNFIVKDKNSSGQKTRAANPIKNDEANLRIDFFNGSIKQIRKDILNDDGEIETEGAFTLLITNISYKDNSNVIQNQSLKGISAEDTSNPVLKVDSRLLSEKDVSINNETEVFVPVNTQYKIPVYGLDIVKSSSSLTINATVNYYERNPDNGEFVLKDSNVSSGSLNFQVRETEGYYLIEKLTIKDGVSSPNTVTFENKTGSIKKLNDDISMPIKVQGVKRTTDPSKAFAFNVTEDYAKLFSGLELQCGSKNKVVFPMPQILANVSNDTGVRSYVGDNLENPFYIQYKLYYQYGSDYSDTWIENKTVNSNVFGLEFIAPKTGDYNFWIEALDRQGNSLSSIYSVNSLDGKISVDTSKIITLSFINTEIPEITVNNFSDEAIVNKKFTIPSATIQNDYNALITKTIALYCLNEDGSYDESGRIDLATDNSFTPDDDMLGKEFIVVYNAINRFSFNPEKGELEATKAIEVVRTFKVVEAPPLVGGGFEWNALSIVFLSLGGASLLGIIVILLIKPKEKAN